MPNIKLHMKEQPMLELLQHIPTGRHMYPRDFHERMMGMPVEPSRGPEITDWYFSERIGPKPEICFQTTIAVRLLDSPDSPRQTAKMFSQYFYSPLLNDLNAIETHLINGDTSLALQHLDALRAHLCGQVYG